MALPIMPDWDPEDETEVKGPQKGAPVSQPKKVESKWKGEDEDDDDPASDWEESSEEEEEEAKPAVAPPKKKGTLKAKLAEKEAAKAASKAEEEDTDDSDDVSNPTDKARIDKEREINADLNNTTDLLGAAALGGTSSSELDTIISCQPRTKEDFQDLSQRIIEFITKRHETKPHYPGFVEYHARQLCLQLKDVEVRKVASGLTTLANEKQKEQREKASGKKKPKTSGKPALGGVKPSGRLDINPYDEVLDDFGSRADDFM